MSYFHPRDFDINQPIVPGLSLTRQFRAYVGIRNCKPKLEKWLSDFDFIDINTADKIVLWDNAPIIKI